MEGWTVWIGDKVKILLQVVLWEKRYGHKHFVIRVVGSCSDGEVAEVAELGLRICYSSQLYRLLYASCTGNSFSSSSCEPKQHTTACTAGCCSKYAAQARQLRQLLHHYRNLRPESRNACDHIFFPTARPATVS